MDTLCKKLLLAVLVVVIGQYGTAQEKVSKKVSNTYSLTDAGELQLVNKYGNVTINGWDKEELSVEISIAVNHRKKENAEELLERIRPVIREGDDLVSLEYEIVEKSSGWFANFFEKANPFDYDRSNIQIDYTINVPSKAELKLTNTFGDIVIDNWSGKLKALAEHGDLWIGDDLNKADVTIRYGKLRAQDIDYGSIDIKNGALDLRTSKSLRLNSSGSDIVMNTVASFEVYANKDEITIDQVDRMFGNLKFTTLEIDRLSHEADMTLRVADFRVASITDQHADIAIEQESSEISLVVTDFSHRFSAIIEQGLVRLPKSFTNIDSKILDKGKKLREISASYGTTTNGRISIKGKKGIVLLKER